MKNLNSPRKTTFGWVSAPAGNAYRRPIRGRARWCQVGGGGRNFGPQRCVRIRSNGSASRAVRFNS